MIDQNIKNKTITTAAVGRPRHLLPKNPCRLTFPRSAGIPIRFTMVKYFTTSRNSSPKMNQKGREAILEYSHEF